MKIGRTWDEFELVEMESKAWRLRSGDPACLDDQCADDLMACVGRIRKLTVRVRELEHQAHSEEELTRG